MPAGEKAEAAYAASRPASEEPGGIFKSVYDVREKSNIRHSFTFYIYIAPSLLFV